MTLPFFSLVDVRYLLPPDWEQQLHQSLPEMTRQAELLGGEPTSLEPVGTVITYELADGTSVASRLPWLYELYTDQFKAIASRVADQELQADDDVRSAVNVNVLPAGGDGYELHVDSNPVTAVLFLSTHRDGEGGELRFLVAESHWLSVSPLAGTLAVFDARDAPHQVCPSASRARISAPMNYFTPAAGRQRPEGLDERLYGGK